MDVTREPGTSVIHRVSLGDKSSGTIATVALRKTAEMAKDNYPKASELLVNNTYMDDIINSVDNVETANKLTNEMETILSNGNFKIKEWIYSHDKIAPDHDRLPSDMKTAHGKVLGVRPFAAKPSRDLLFIQLGAATLRIPEMEKACRKHQNGQV